MRRFQVVLLRTGVLVHVKKYMQTLGLLPLDTPEKPQAAELAQEVVDTEAEDQPDDAGTSPCVCRGLL